jgi:hypothetical protein
MRVGTETVGNAPNGGSVSSMKSRVIVLFWRSSSRNALADARSSKPLTETSKPSMKVFRYSAETISAKPVRSQERLHLDSDLVVLYFDAAWP